MSACGTRTCGKTLGHDLSLLNGSLVEHGVKEFVKFLWLHTLDDSLLVNLAFAEQIHGNFHHSSAGALAVTGLEQPELAVLNSELHILHVAIVLFKSVLNFNKLCSAFRHRLLERREFGLALFFADALQLSPTAAAFGHDLLRGAYTSHHVFALSVDEVFTVEHVFASSGIAREANASSRVVAHVTIDHSLHIHSSAIFFRNLIHLAVEDSALVIPAVEHSIDGSPKLIPCAGGEILASVVFHSLLEQVYQILEVVNFEFGIEFHAFFLLHVFNDFFKWVDVGLVLGLHAKHHITIHLHETTIAVPCEAGITRFFGQRFGNSVVNTQVEHGIHHTRHRYGCARTNRYQLRVGGVVELVAS